MVALEELGYTAAAFTDINNTSACLEYQRRAKQHGIHAVAGIDLRNGAQPCFVGLAANSAGFKNLNDYLSFHLHNQLPIPRRAVTMPGTFVIYPFSLFSKKEELEENEYIGLRISDLNRLRFSGWMQYPEKLVMLHSSTFRYRRDHNAHRLLRAIDNNTLLSKLSPEETGKEDDLFLEKEELIRKYSEFPFILRNTERLLEECRLDLKQGEEKESRNKKSFTGSVAEDKEMIRRLCLEGIPYRYSAQHNEQVKERLEKELDVIERKDFMSYFLINHNIVSYARRQGYFYVGRGSGANSIIAYLLRITDVDPIELDLYFERFINLYRSNPPDFDIDFSWTDRDDITRYIFETYPNTALVGAYNTFQKKAVIRQLGKVFGLPAHEIEKLQKEERATDHISSLILKYKDDLNDLPSHLSVHASGILISEGSIHHCCSTFLPPKGYPTTQFDMEAAEDAGLYKFDILSQRGLGKIKDGVSLVAANRPDEPLIDIHDIQRFKSDEKIKKLLREGKAMGCFYVESPAMRMLLKKLAVDDYLGLVAASSIIRPGVSQSGMMREYLLRHRQPERRKEAHPVLLSIMPDTYGVMVYQEDVIKVAHLFADLTLAEADVIRRGMSGKFRAREEFQRVEEAFFENCRKKGYALQLVKEVWYQISSFAGFAFAKGHSASYAVESYQSLFLKAYYPLEFLTAVFNNSGGFYSLETYVHEARMEGAVIHAPCVNTSDHLAVIKGECIFLGFIHLGGLEADFARQIIEERSANGLFLGLDDFLERLPDSSLEQLSILIRIDAFRFSGIPKRALLWKAHLHAHASPPVEHTRPLFKMEKKDFRIPSLHKAPHEDAFDQMELLGFSLCSPFELLAEAPRGRLLAGDLEHHKDETVSICGYLVTIKKTQTGKGESMNFGTFLDHRGYFFDTVHFPPVARRFPFRGKGIYEIKGKVTEEFGFYCIEVQELTKLPGITDPRYSEPKLQSLTA